MSSSRLTIAHLWHSWDHWWTRTGPPHALAIFRIAFGAFLVFYFGLQIPHVRMLYSSDTALLPMFLPTSWPAVIFASPPPWAAYILFGSFLTSLVCVTIGFGTRVAAAVAFLLYLYYRVLSLYHFGTSFDRIFITILLVLAFSDAGATFSVDMWRKRGSFFAWEPISILPQRILAVQLTATYFGVGAQKFVLPAWQSGEVLSWGFMGRWATPLGFWISQLNLPLWFYDLMVLQVKICEVLIPIGFWLKSFRWWAFAYGALFHTLITLTMAIWWFQILIPAYIVFFEPEEVYGFCKRVFGRRIL